MDTTTHPGYEEVGDAGKPKHPLVLLDNAIAERRARYEPILKAVGVNFDTFKSAALTGVNKTPDLLKPDVDKGSLFDSLSQACRDGLLPDGREGALVIHSTNVAKKGQPAKYVDKVAWMPMVKGVLKKIRGAENVASVHDGIVYKNDDFDYWIDDEGPHLRHRPSWTQGDRLDKDIIATYALVRLTNGEKQVEVVGRIDLDKMKAASKTGKNGKGPWATWYPQMAKKGAWHRLAPKLPLDDDIMKVINRDEDLYDFNKAEKAGKTEKDITPGKAEKGRSSRLSSIIGSDDDTQDESHEHEPAESGDQRDGRPAAQYDAQATGETLEDFAEYSEHLAP